MSKQYLDRDGLQIVANKTEKKFRYDAMPPAGSSFEGKIIQYVGTTTPNYKQGFFYTSVEDSGNWSWEVVNVSEGLEHWIGTQAEYEAQKENIPDGAIIALTDEIDTTYDYGRYSTDEVVTGQRWVDNKPIYRKVFTGLSLTLTTSWTQVPSIDTSEIDNIIHSDGITTGGAAITVDASPRASYPDYYLSLEAPLSPAPLGILILEYTKTTD